MMDLPLKITDKCLNSHSQLISKLKLCCEAPQEASQVPFVTVQNSFIPYKHEPGKLLIISACLKIEL